MVENKLLPPHVMSCFAALMQKYHNLHRKWYFILSKVRVVCVFELATDQLMVYNVYSAVIWHHWLHCLISTQPVGRASFLLTPLHVTEIHTVFSFEALTEPCRCHRLKVSKCGGVLGERNKQIFDIWSGQVLNNCDWPTVSLSTSSMTCRVCENTPLSGSFA